MRREPAEAIHHAAELHSIPAIRDELLVFSEFRVNVAMKNIHPPCGI